MKEDFFPVSDFAAIARTGRNTLRYYDKIGLLSPVLRGNNKYRYYSQSQLAAVNLIRTMQSLGMSLAEIRDLKDAVTPELMDGVLTSLEEKLRGKIAECEQSRTLLLTLQNIISSTDEADETAIKIQFMPEEPIILGDLNAYGENRNGYDALHDFYGEQKKKHPELDLNYPVWALYSRERVKRGECIWPDRYYFYNPAGADRRPAGFYAIGYKRGGYGDSGGLYRRLLAYIEKNNFVVSGDAYEEYPLNEICIRDDKNYLIRVMIAVSQKACTTKILLKNSLNVRF